MEGFDIASRRPIGEVRMSHRLFEDPTRIAGVRAYQAAIRSIACTGGRRRERASCRARFTSRRPWPGRRCLSTFTSSRSHRTVNHVRSELVMTAAASIAGAIFQMGQQVGLVTNGRDAADRIRTEGWSHEQLYSRRVAQAAGMREKSDRLRPVVVPTRRSNTQLTDILQTLARVEKTDGFTFPQLVRRGG